MSETLLNKLRTTKYTSDTSEEYTLYEFAMLIRCGDANPDPNYMEILDSTVKNHVSCSRNINRTRFNIWAFLHDNIEGLDKCQDCNGFDYQDDMIYAYDDNPICHNCRDEYTFSDSRDMYVSHEDFEDEDCESNHDEYIYEYCEDVMNHCSYTQSDKDRPEVNPLYLGVELEVERRRDCPYEIGEMTTNDFYNKGNQFAIMKSDGSLSNGFEIVTCPATLNAHRENWDKFFNGEAIKHLKSWNTDTTGMHIHISRNHLYQLEIGKLLVFINDQKNEEFINHIAGRSSDQWAKKSPKKIMDCVNSSDKYEAVNISHRHTVELRIFKGNLARQGMFRVLEFAHALVGFCKLTSMTKLSYKDFIKYMELPQNRSEYKIFYGWLSRKSYCIGKPSRKVNWSDEQNNLKEIA